MSPPSKSAYEAAAAAAPDARCVPVTLDRPAAEGAAIAYPDYETGDHETWSLLYARQGELLPGRACAEFLEGLRWMEFDGSRIPALADVHEVLRKTTSWGAARAPGLLHERDFFAFLARRVFPSTDYIRPRSELDYTPAPDLFHDIFGHTPLITNPTFADFYQRLGRAALAAQGSDRRRLERFYWFTVEFGLIDTAGGLRAYGNGILSSRAELLHSLSGEVETRPFDAEAIAEQEYDVWHLQPVLFVIESFDQLLAEFDRWSRGRGWL